VAAGSAERERLLTATVADATAAYGLRAEAARLLAPHAAASGSETRPVIFPRLRSRSCRETVLGGSAHGCGALGRRRRG
jgi:hypothetical protein